MQQSVLVWFCIHYASGWSVSRSNFFQLNNKAPTDLSTDFNFKNHLNYNQNLKLPGKFTTENINSKLGCNKIRYFLRKLKQRSKFKMIKNPKIGQRIHKHVKASLAPKSRPRSAAYALKPEMIHGFQTEINPQKNFASLHALKIFRRDFTTHSGNFKKSACKNVSNFDSKSKFGRLFNFQNLKRKSIKKQSDLTHLMMKPTTKRFTGKSTLKIRKKCSLLSKLLEK